ncbi:MAG: hypothetical protein ACYDDV_02845 [Methanoregula sp.]
MTTGFFQGVDEGNTGFVGESGTITSVKNNFAAILGAAAKPVPVF